MNINEAFELTNTKNKAQLGKSLGMTPQAVYQWDEASIPKGAELAVLELAGLVSGKQTSSSAQSK